MDTLTALSHSKSFGNLTTVDENNKENLLRASDASQSVDNLEALAAAKEADGTISVRERTKTFNRMASETEVSSLSGSTLRLSSVKRRNSRAVESGGGGSRRGSAFASGAGGGRDDAESHDSASITTLDPAIKSWMVQISKGTVFIQSN